MREDAETLSLFLQDSEQLLEQLDTLLLAAEAENALSADTINELFRLVHTLKGSAAMINQAGLAHTAHLAENLLQQRRQNPADTNAVSAVLAVSLDFTAYFRQSLSDLAQGQAAADASAIDLALTRLQEGGAENTAAPVPSPAAGSQRPSELHRYLRCHINLQPCALASLRAYLIYRAISGTCAASYTVPNALQSHPELAETIERDGFELGFIPKDGIAPEKILALLQKQPLFDHLDIIAQPTAAPKERPAVAARISVSQEQINHLIDRNAELLAAETALARKLREQGVLDSATEKLLHTVSLNCVLLQNDLNELGLTPLSGLFLRMQRLARDQLRNSDKQAEVILEGGETLVDAGMLEPLQEMLLHTVRNAVDHGLEGPEERLAAGKAARGSLHLRARRKNGRLLLTVADDGQGIRRDKVLAAADRRGLLTKAAGDYSSQEVFDFLLLGGFTTKTEVSQSSGRGVGLDAVRHLAAKTGGSLQISSVEGQGSQFLFNLPLSLTAVDVLRLSRRERVCYVPVNVVERVLPVAGLEFAADRSLCHRERVYQPLMFQRKGELAVLFHTETRDCYLTCDRVGEPESLLVRPLPAILQQLLGENAPYSGCLQDSMGGVYLLFDILALAAGAVS